MQRAVRALSALLLVLLLAPIVILDSALPASAATLPAPTLTAPAASASVTANPLFSWNAVPSAATYHFVLSTQSNLTNPTYEIVTPNLHATPPGDLAQTTWYWRVATRDATGVEGSFSATRSFTKGPPTAPTGLVPADGKTFVFPTEPVSLSWTPMAGAKAYQVEISNNILFTPPLEVQSTTFEPTLTLTNVQTIGQTFYWRVRAFSASDLPSQFSATRTYSLSWNASPTQTAPPDTLGTPIEQIDFAWNPLVGAVSYDLQVSPNVDFTSGLVVNANVLAAKYSPPTTLQNGAYYWRVRGRNASNAAGVWSPVHQFVKAWPAPDAAPFNRVSLISPANLDYTVDEPTFTWSPVRLASRYEVQFSTDVNFSPGSINSCITTHTTYTPYVGCFDPAPNTVWHWRVRPLDDPGGINGLFSTTRSFQWYPHANASQLVILNSPANGASTSLPVLTWTLVRNIGRYRVTVLNKDGAGVTGGDTYANQFVPNGLDKTQGPFSWYVQTIDSNGRLGPIPGSGQWRTFTLTDPTTGGSLGTPTATPTAAVHGPLLGWQAVTGATSYKIWKAPLGSNIYSVLASGLTGNAYRHPGVDLTPGNWSFYVEAFNVANALISTSSLGSFTSNTLGALPKGTAQMIHSIPPVNAYGSPSDNGCPIQTAQVDCAAVLDTPTFKWNPVDWADHYQLVLATDPNFTNITRTYVTSLSQLTPIESLVDSQAGQSTYWYAVPCAGSVCAPQPNTFAGDEDSPVWFFRKQSRPVDLIGPANNASVANLVTFSWKDYLQTNQDALDGKTKVPASTYGYRVVVSTTPDFANIIDTSPIVDGLTYTATGLYPEGPIFWRVQAVDGSGNLLTWSATRQVTKSSPAVIQVAPTDGATTSLVPTFKWNPQAYAYIYQVEVYRNVDQALTGGNIVYSVNTTAAAATPTNALAAGTYGWRVRRLDGAGRPGPWSADDNAGLWKFTYNGPATTLLQPSNGAVMTDNTLLMTWTPVGGAAQYRIDVATDSGFANLKEQLGTVMTAYASPATYANGTYYWRVLTIDGQGNAIATSATFSFLKDAGSGGDFYPLSPARLLDTRVPADAPALQPAQPRYLQVTGRGGVPAAGVSAIVANVTIVNPTAGSWLTVWPAGGALPTVSNLNYTPGQTVPNLVTVKLSSNGQIGLQNQFGTANVIVDVVGYYSDGTLEEAPDGSRFTATPAPTRILDTRTTVPPRALGPGDGNIRSVQVAGIGGVPSGASAVVMNVTAVSPTTGSYMTIWPHGVTKPLASNLNYNAGQTVPNLVIMKVGTEGKVDMFNAAGNVDVIFDVVGYFQNTPSPPSGSRFRDIAPGRLADTRFNFPSGGRLASGAIRSFQVAGQVPQSGGVAPVPATGAIAVVLNVTVVSPSGGGYATVYPSDATQPLASNLNFVTNQVVPNLVTARLGSDGAVKVFTTTATDVIIDVVGWYAVPVT